MSENFKTVSVLIDDLCGFKEIKVAEMKWPAEGGVEQCSFIRAEKEQFICLMQPKAEEYGFNMITMKHFKQNIF